MSPVVLADSGTAAKIFILDTNVLMHDPTALFKFQEHHVYLPMTVLEELDNAKLGVSEVARNVRQTNRFIDELMTVQKEVVIEEGLQLNHYSPAEEPYKCSGRLFFQTEAHDSSLPKSLPGNKNDNSILNTILSLRDQVGDHEIILISKDINLRISSHPDNPNNQPITDFLLWTRTDPDGSFDPSRGEVQDDAYRNLLPGTNAPFALGFRNIRTEQAAEIRL